MQIHPHRSIKIGDSFFTQGDERDFLDSLAGNDTQVICRRLLAYESSGALQLRPDTKEAVEEAARGGANEVVQQLSEEARQSDHIDSGRSLLDMLGKAKTEQDSPSSGAENADSSGGQPEQSDETADMADSGGGNDEQPEETEEEPEDAGGADREMHASDLPDGLTDKQKEKLHGAGYATAEEIPRSQEELEEIDGIGEANAEEILSVLGVESE